MLFFFVYTVFIHVHYWKCLYRCLNMMVSPALETHFLYAVFFSHHESVVRERLIDTDLISMLPVSLLVLVLLWLEQ